MTLTILEILYLVLIIFWSIIGTLLIIVLLKVNKILAPITEIVDFYNKIKVILWNYEKIPEVLKESVKEKLGKSEKKNPSEK